MFIAKLQNRNPDTVALITCCNADGNFLPPYCIFKVKRKTSDFQVGMQPGSGMTMNGTCVYVTTLYGLKEGSFRTLEAIRKCSAHISSSHVTLFGHRCSWPRYRGWRYTTVSYKIHNTLSADPGPAFFRPLKTFRQQAVYNWIHSNTVRKTTRFQLSTLLVAACNQAATVLKGSAGFSACGIHPYDTHSPHPILLWTNAIPLHQ